MKTLYLHIGHYKTGTTALQTFWARNAKRLAKAGLCYLPPFTNNKHSALAFSLLAEAGVDTLMYGYSKPETPEAIWAPLWETIEQTRCDKILVSSEEFMRIGAHPRAADALERVTAPWRGKLSIRPLIYLRDPAEHLPSWYNQLVKMGQMVPDYGRAVSEIMEDVHYDYLQALEPWQRIFGADALILRPYHSGVRSGKALMKDAMQAMDVKVWLGNPLWQFRNVSSNQRLDDRMLELRRVLTLIRAPENYATRVMQRTANVFEREETLIRREAEAFAEIADRSRASLENLSAASHGAIRPDVLGWRPPDPPSPQQAELTLAMTVLLQEQVLLREMLQERFVTLSDRIDAIEAAGKKRT